MKSANFQIIESTKDYLLIRDMGPWDKHPTITNDAENIVEKLAGRLYGRRLEYIDSAGMRDQLLVENGKFVGYSSV